MPTNSTHLLQQLYLAAKTQLLKELCVFRKFSTVTISFVKTSRNEIIALEILSLPCFAESVRKSCCLPSQTCSRKMPIRGEANNPVFPQDGGLALPFFYITSLWVHEMLCYLGDFRLLSLVLLVWFVCFQNCLLLQKTDVEHFLFMFWMHS